jgi:hypothetical protein
MRLVGHSFIGADFHGPIEGEIPVVDLLKDFRRRLQAVIAFQYLRAENFPCDFDFLRQPDFLLARQQRDFAHLREIHPDGVVDALGRGLGQFRFEIQIERFIIVIFINDDLLFLGARRAALKRLHGLGGGFLAGFKRGLLRLGRGAAGFRELGHVRVVDETDSHLVDHHQQRIELVRRNDFIGKPLVQLVVGEVSAGSSKVQESLHAQVNLFLRA